LSDLEHIRVGIHDNEDNKRRQYEIFEKVADVVIRNQKLWVYKLKMDDNNNIEERLQNLWDQIQTRKW